MTYVRFTFVCCHTCAVKYDFASALNQPIGGWQTSNVATMAKMFLKMLFKLMTLCGIQ